METTERSPDTILFFNILLKNIYNCIIIGVHRLMINVPRSGAGGGGCGDLRNVWRGTGSSAGGP